MKTAQQDRVTTAQDGTPQDAGKATEPQASWDVDRLTAYARREIEEAVSLGKRTALHLYRAGHALSLIRNKLKRERQWVKWQKEHRLSRTVVNDAIRIYEAAGSEKAVSRLTVMRAYDRFGIAKRARADNGEDHEQEPSARNGRAEWNGVPLRSAALRELPPFRKARIIHAALAYLLDDLTRRGSNRLVRLKPTLDRIVELVEAVTGAVQARAGKEGGE